MKNLTAIIAAVLLLLTACSTSKKALPFAPDGKYGKNPTLRNKPVKNNIAWIERQWKGEGR